MATNKEELFECVIPLPDALIRKTIGEPTKSVKHGDHDQSDHGNWAHGGASDRSGGNVAKYIRAHGLQTTVSNGPVPDMRDKERAMWKIKKDTMNNSTLHWDHRNDTPEMRAVRLQERQIETAATILAQGYKGMREVPNDNWRVIELFAPDGSLAAAAMGTLQDQGNGEKAFAMRFFGSLGTVEGAGTAIMAKALEMAADANAEFRLIKVQEGSHAWYQQWGFDTMGTSGAPDMSKEKVAEWVANYRAAATKSLKHGDHDQSDHGNWATGGSAGAGDSKDNPIRTSDVEEAARALGEGKHVQLSSPDQVATLLDRLNELAKEAEAAGSKAKNIDLCNVTVPGTNLFCIESKGIPRVEMPQLKGIPNAGSPASDLVADKRGEVDITEAYLEQLRSSGITLDEDEALASHLKATQNELNGNKVAGIMTSARAGELDLNQPIVVSRDGYIVDGHHRWAAKVALEHDGIDDPETDMKIPVVRVDQDILDILESSKQFAADMGLPQVAVKFLKHGDHDQSDHGNWAHGGAPRPTLSAEEKATAEEVLLKHLGGRQTTSAYQSAFQLTDLEVAAFSHYGGFGYMEINNLLRGEGSDWGMAYAPEVVRAAELLESAMEKASLQTDTKLYRGMHRPTEEANKLLASLKPGQVYTDPSFTSTSKSEKVASGFALDRAPDDRTEDRTSIIWEMLAPAGTSALDYDKLFPTSANTEKEVLLASDTHFRILGTQREGYTSHGEPIIRVTATVIPTGTQPVKHADHDQSEHGNWATGRSDAQYRGSHQAPGRSNGAPLSDLLRIYPDDVYEKGIEYYSHYGDRNNPIEKEAWSTVARMRGNPDAQIQIYRAIPTGAPSEINAGDWVTIVRDYAKEHGEGPLMGNYKIVEATARAGDLFTAGDSIMEWGWQPPSKSFKHADHDQSDHGSWADGSVPLAKTPIDQVDALRQWSSNSYDQVNKALRDPNTLAAQERNGKRDMWQKTQDGLDRLFKGVPPTTRPWTLYRGATGEFVTDIVKQYDSMIEKGRAEYQATGKPPTSFVLPRFTDNGFVSTSPDKDVAMHFSGSNFQGGWTYTGEGRAIFEINLPEGSKMVNVEEYVNEFGGFAKFAAEESEFLLPRGLTFEVTDVTPSNDQFGDQGPLFYTIKLDVVPSSTKSVKHADHDQSDHGSWADGERYTAETRSVAEKALAHYSIDGYHRINSYLRKIDPSDDDLNTGDFDPKPVIKEIDSLFNSAPPLKNPVTVFRGLDSEVAANITWKQGDIYTDSAFMSTSLSEAVSERFTGYGGTGSYIMKIEVPAGTAALTPSMFASLVDEEEVILNRGTTLQITGTEFKDNFNYIYATVVPSTATKSVKHGDHDQSEHGNWARGGADHQYTGKPRSASSRERMNEHTDRYGDPERRESGRKSGSRNLGREVTYMEIVALESYKGGGYGEINRYLRGTQEGDDWTKDRVDAVKALAMPTTEPMIVTRMMPLFAVEGIAAGQVYEDKGFMSTGKGDHPAQFFHGYPVQMQIEVPAGTPVVDFDNFSGLDGWGNIEREVTLMPNTQLQIDRVEQRNWNRDFGPTETDGLMVYARLIPATKSVKHADHDQSDHGSWSTGRSPQFSEDENGAITIYQDQGHMEINRYLRGTSITGTPYSDETLIKKWTASLDSAITTAGPTTRPMTIYRGISGRHLEELRKGGVFEDLGFASFSKSGETASEFATGAAFGYTRKEGAVLELDLPAGSFALDMESHSMSTEQEVLLPRGSRFELISGPEELDLSNEEDNENNRLPVYQVRLVPPTKSIKHGDHDQSDHGNWARGFDAPSSSVPTPAGSKTTVPLWWHERDKTLSLDNMRNGMEASVREALDAYTHWSADDGYETGTRLAFHAALNERLRAGESRFKAVEAVARLFAEADDEELVAKLGRGFMDIDNALRDSKVMADMTVTRASSPIMSIDELEAAAKGAPINIYGQAITPGAVYSDAGIVSTSADMSYQSTQFFAQNWENTEGLMDWQVPTTVRWNIDLPAGAPALDLRALGFESQHGESEVLLPRNTHFRIEGVNVELPKFDGAPAKVTVNATVIPTHSTTKP